MGSKSILSKSFLSLSVLLMLAAYAGPARAQSFDAGAEKKLRFGVNLMRFKGVFVDETSDTQNLVITTSQKTITLDNVNVKPPFIETGCTCVFLANNVGTTVDCDNESLPLDLPGFDAATGQQPTICKIGVAFQPTSAGRVDNPFGVRIDFGAHNDPKFVRLVGIGAD
jgi:hypothetical protein